TSGCLMIPCSEQVLPCAIIKTHMLPEGLRQLKMARAGVSTSSTIHLQPLSIIKQWPRYRTSVQRRHSIVHPFHLYGPVNLTERWWLYWKQNRKRWRTASGHF